MKALTRFAFLNFPLKTFKSFSQSMKSLGDTSFAAWMIFATVPKKSCCNSIHLISWKIKLEEGWGAGLDEWRVGVAITTHNLHRKTNSGHSLAAAGAAGFKNKPVFGFFSPKRGKKCDAKRFHDVEVKFFACPVVGKKPQSDFFQQPFSSAN